MSVILAAVAAAGYAASDITSAAAVRRVSPAAIAFWAHVVAAVLLLVPAALVAPIPAGSGLVVALVAGAIAGVGVLAYYAALQRGPASVLAPLAASGLALPVLLGVARGERTVVLAAVGLVFLLVGVTLLAGRDRSGVRVEPLAIGLGLIGATAFGGYFITVDLAVGSGNPHPLWVAGLVAVGTAAVALPALVWTDGRRAFSPAPAGRAAYLAVGVLLAVADLALAAAMAGGDVALVSVVASSDPALTVFGARVLLAECVSRRQAAGIGLALAGLLSVAAA
jgi:drug/metabolite transporter (DMT)-like permease